MYFIKSTQKWCRAKVALNGILKKNVFKLYYSISFGSPFIVWRKQFLCAEECLSFDLSEKKMNIIFVIALAIVKYKVLITSDEQKQMANRYKRDTRTHTKTRAFYVYCILFVFLLSAAEQRNDENTRKKLKVLMCFINIRNM